MQIGFRPSLYGQRKNYFGKFVGVIQRRLDLVLYCRRQCLWHLYAPRPMDRVKHHLELKRKCFSQLVSLGLLVHLGFGKSEIFYTIQSNIPPRLQMDMGLFLGLSLRPMASAFKLAEETGYCFVCGKRIVESRATRFMIVERVERQKTCRVFISLVTLAICSSQCSRVYWLAGYSYEETEGR